MLQSCFQLSLLGCASRLGVSDGLSRSKLHAKTTRGLRMAAAPHGLPAQPFLSLCAEIPFTGLHYLLLAPLISP